MDCRCGMDHIHWHIWCCLAAGAGPAGRFRASVLTAWHCSLSKGTRDTFLVWGGSLNGGSPKWMVYRENPIKVDDFGSPYIWKPLYMLPAGGRQPPPLAGNNWYNAILFLSSWLCTLKLSFSMCAQHLPFHFSRRSGMSHIESILLRHGIDLGTIR